MHVFPAVATSAAVKLVSSLVLGSSGAVPPYHDHVKGVLMSLCNNTCLHRQHWPCTAASTLHCSCDAGVNTGIPLLRNDKDFSPKFWKDIAHVSRINQVVKRDSTTPEGRIKVRQAASRCHASSKTLVRRNPCILSHEPPLCKVVLNCCVIHWWCAQQLRAIVRGSGVACHTPSVHGVTAPSAAVTATAAASVPPPVDARTASAVTPSASISGMIARRRSWRTRCASAARCVIAVRL